MKTILIADPECEAGITEALKRSGYLSITEASGQAALDILQSGAPIDLVIAELRFHDMDGLAFLSSAKRLAPGLPIIVVTSLCSVESYLLAIHLGAAEFVNKPVSMALLLRIMHSILEQARPRGFPSEEAPSTPFVYAKYR